jgi:hypothetical protein
MLIVLDNAADVDQVRPLLPGGRGCLVVVTSRSRLTGLVAEYGAQPLELELLTNAEAYQLLSRYLGTDRVAADLEATERVIEYCARLPIALAVAAAQAAVQPSLTLASLASQFASGA